MSHRVSFFSGAALAIVIAFATVNAVEPQPAPAELTLDDAVQIALRQNPDILKAKQDIERTRGLVIEVRAQALPRLTLTSSYSQQDENLLEGSNGSSGSSQATPTPTPAPTPDPQAGGGAGGQPQVPETPDTSQSQSSNNDQSGQFGNFSVQDKSWRIAVEARQVIYAGGQVRSALKIADFQRDSSYYSLLETINTVIANVRKEFYQVLVNRALIEVQEESVALLGDELEDQKNRFDAGTVPRINVLRAEVELSNVRPTLIRAKNALVISELRLAKLLSIRPGDGDSGLRPPFNVRGRLEVNRRPVDLEAALMAARVQRAFLKVQRQTMLIEAEQIRLAISGYKPRIYVSGGYEARNSRLSDDLGDTVNGWFFGVNGSWAIFDGFESYGKVKQAKARLESAKINYDDSVLEVDLQVRGAYSQVQEARALVLSQTKNVEQAMEALRLARERFRAGASTQLDLLDARVALTRARVTEVEARFDYNTAMADFESVTGDVTVYRTAFEDPMIRKLEKRIKK